MKKHIITIKIIIPLMLTNTNKIHHVAHINTLAKQDLRLLDA